MYGSLTCGLSRFSCKVLASCDILRRTTFHVRPQDISVLWTQDQMLSASYCWKRGRSWLLWGATPSHCTFLAWNGWRPTNSGERWPNSVAGLCLSWCPQAVGPLRKMTTASAWCFPERLRRHSGGSCAALIGHIWRPRSNCWTPKQGIAWVEAWVWVKSSEIFTSLSLSFLILEASQSVISDKA